MKKRHRNIKACLLPLVIFALAITACNTRPTPQEYPVQSQGGLKVTRVLDGDTLIVEGTGSVRLIGVNTPETARKDRPDEFFAEEALAFTRKMAESKKVRLEYGREKKDSYGRTLAYVFLSDGTFLNAEIIKQGYGLAYTRFPFKYSGEFIEYEKKAIEDGKGLWKERPDAWEGLDVISWKDAAHYYGRNVIVEGTIAGTYNSGRACFLNFHTDWKKHFTAVIFAGSFHRFPPEPEKYYNGKAVRIRGKVKEYEGRPEMILEHPGQIQRRSR